MTQDRQKLAKSIDHTLLRPNTTRSEYAKLCAEAREHGFFSVCVPPAWVNFCAKELKGAKVAVCTVVGFPFGYTFPGAKAAETKLAVENGATEIDMVMNISALLSEDIATVSNDILAVRAACPDLILKVILETCYLNDEQIKKACELCETASADFVKTSTGFGSAGASVEHVRLMRKSVSEKVSVKASGGVRDFETAKKMLAAGATRLGTSNGISIVTGATGQGAY